MESRLQERNQNFLKPSSISILQDSLKNQSIALRKQKRLHHQNEVRQKLPNGDPPNIEHYKSIIKSSSIRSEVFHSLETIQKLILHDKDFPFDSIFDMDFMHVLKSYINQAEDFAIRRVTLSCLVNASVYNKNVTKFAVSIGIDDILLSLLKITNDNSEKIVVIYALGNIHDDNAELSNKFQLMGHWEDLLNSIKIPDLDLIAAAVWSLSIYYKKGKSLPDPITQKIFSQVFPLFRTRDTSVLQEMLWLFYYMMSDNQVIIEKFADCGLLDDLFSYISMANLTYVSPACKIVECIIIRSEKYSKVFIDMGISSRISASFESKNNSHKVTCLHIYSILLGRSKSIAWQLINEPQFIEFVKHLNGPDKAILEIVSGIYSLAYYKDLMITGYLLKKDFIKFLIPLLKSNDSNILVTVIGILTNIFDLYSHQSKDEYETLINYFQDLQGVYLLENLDLHKNFQVQNDSKVFIETFYGSASGNLLIPTSTFMIS